MYAFGEHASEITRLRRQGIIFDEFSRRFLAKAGLRPGWRVLDLGSGTGAVTFLAAEIVGTQGYVRGVDVSFAATEAARLQAVADGWRNVEFVHGDLDRIKSFDGFDAVIGRFIVSYLETPEILFERLGSTKGLRRIAFQEWLLNGELLCFPAAPSVSTMHHLVQRALQSCGVHLDMALRMWSTLTQLDGWTTSKPEVVSLTLRGREDPDMVDYLLATAGAMENVMLSRGLVGSEEEARLLWRQVRADLERSDRVLLLSPVIGVWADRRGS